MSVLNGPQYVMHSHRHLHALYNSFSAAPNGISFACEANGVLKTVIVSNAFALQVYLPGPVLVCFVIIPDSRLLAMHP